ncbi:MAG: hypothetical protein M3T55_14880, partial [Pseudomonadota bacterium]|nr:hypothetical protein [Pseudomonadota bacterium]
MTIGSWLAAPKARQGLKGADRSLAGPKGNKATAMADPIVSPFGAFTPAREVAAGHDLTGLSA